MPVTVYWIARQSRIDDKTVVWLIGGLAAFGLYLSLTAVAEVRQWWPLVYPRYIASAEYEFLGRGRGPLLNPAANGIFIGLGLCCAWMLWPRLGRLAALRQGASASAAAATEPNNCAAWLNWPRLAQLVLVALTLIYLAGAYATLTRCAWMGVAAGLTLVVWLRAPRAWRAVIGGSMLVAAMLVVATQWENIWVYKRDKHLSAEQSAESALLRPVLAAVAWRIFLDRPLLGVGYGQYEVAHFDYLHDRTSELPIASAADYAQHNVLLSLLTEAGLPGAAAFAVLLALWVAVGWRVWRGWQGSPGQRDVGFLLLALLAVYLPNAMFQDVSVITMVNMLLFFIAGLAVGVDRQSRASGLIRASGSPVATDWPPLATSAACGR
jgi:O-antigen ligase